MTEVPAIEAIVEDSMTVDVPNGRPLRSSASIPCPSVIVTVNALHSGYGRTHVRPVELSLVLLYCRTY